MDPEVKIERITPEKAKLMLSKLHPKQRNINEATVARYVGDIKSGRWSETCVQDNICICSDGTLGNGRHRCEAIVRSGRTLRLPVARNVPPEDIEHMDDGRARKASQFLSMPQASHVASLSRCLCAFKDAGQTLSTSLGSNCVSRSRIIEDAEENAEEYLFAVQEAARLRRANGVGSMLGYSTAVYAVTKVREGFNVSAAVDAVRDMSNRTAANYSREVAKAFTSESKPKPSFVMGITIEYLAKCASGSKGVTFKSWEKYAADYSGKLRNALKEG